MSALATGGFAASLTVEALDRDPYPIYAERFDLHRPRQRLATFGFGPHFCSGHAFARALERIALARLLERFPGLALDPGKDVPFSGWEFRAPRALSVRWGAA